MADRLDKQAIALEARKKEIEPQLVPMTEKARAIMEQLQAIRDTIGEADKLKVALLLDAFLDRVYPVFDVKKTKSKTKPRRTEITGFRFIPRDSDTAKKVLNGETKVNYRGFTRSKSGEKQAFGEEMKFSDSRTGTGSSTRPGRSWPGTASSGPPARS